MADSHLYGRNRDSLAGLNEQLEEIFRIQPTVKKRADGTLLLPVTSMREVLRLLFDQVGMAQLTDEDEDKLEKITATNPNIELDPTTLLEFVAQLTANMPESAKLGNFPRKSSPNNEAYILGARGRGHDRNGSGGSRSSSSDSLDRTFEYDADDTQRVPPSPFDIRARQRGGLGHAEPPSSWARRPPPASRRRKSDAGSNYGDSDNESAYGYGSRRPSNPVSPSSSYNQSGMVIPPNRRQGSNPPAGRHSRPPSRSTSSMGYAFPSSRRSESPDALLVQYSPPKDSIPMPRLETDDQEGENDAEGEDKDLIPDPRLSLISFTSSTGDSLEQTESLRKALAEVTKRAADSEKHLQDQLAARELDLEDTQAQLENTREMINTLRKDEKEWRSKERHYVTQINGLETEINRLQRSLDSVRAQHQTLSKQHAEQTTETDKYREAVRERDAEARQLEHKIMTYEHELEKAKQEHELAEENVKQLQGELSKLNEVHGEYLTQKQENVILKETIDRLRYDLDEIRASHAAESAKGGSSAPGSAKPSLSRSLGSELLRKLHPHREESVTESDVETVEEVSEKVEGTDGEEDIFQTIITRKKIVGKGKKTIVQESVMVDAATQYDDELFMTETESDSKPVASTSGSVQVKVEPVSPASRFLQLPRDDPPSYQLSEIEQSGEETLNILRKWHGVKVLGPLPGGISREAIEDWQALKREIGVKCPIIEEIIEQSDKQAGTSRHFGFSPSKRESARRYVEGGKRRFYNIYNTYILGGDRANTETSSEAGTRHSAVEVLSAGKWVVAFGAWSAFLLWYGSGGDLERLVGPGGPTYADRALWSSFNALAGGAGEGFGAAGTAPPVDTVGAVWFVVEKLVRGATDIATRRVGFPS